LGPEVNYEAVGILNSKANTISVWAKKDGTENAEEDLGKGGTTSSNIVVYYLDGEKRVVGMLLWNIFGKLNMARDIIKSRKSFEPKELTTMIKVHEK
jgi:apoptosis-inducing factor 1